MFSCPGQKETGIKPLTGQQKPLSGEISKPAPGTPYFTVFAGNGFKNGEKMAKNYKKNKNRHIDNFEERKRKSEISKFCEHVSLYRFIKKREYKLL